MRLTAPLFLLLAGCGHGDAFLAGRPAGQSGPFQDTRPRRLTLNVGYDNWPSWTPDGTGVYYSSEVMPPGDGDRCLDLLPRRGGTRTEIQCPRNPDGITDELEQATSDGTRLAWARAEVPAPLQAQYSFSIWTASTRPGSRPELAQSFPYDAPSGRSHDAPLYLRWLKPGMLLYLGAEVGGCCRTDTLRFGEHVVLLDLTGPAPVRTFVPGTGRASAVAGSEDGDAVYYTFYGDSRVYRQVLATGAVTVLHDFGAGHIVRDPDVAGNRLVAVVDGKHNLQNVVPFGMVQIDYGGELYLVDLVTGTETRLVDAERLYRRPRLAPDGAGIAAEGYPFTVVTQPGPPPFADTTVVRIDDIWTLEE